MGAVIWARTAHGLTTPLYVSGEKRDENGCITEGFVENGGWYVKIDGEAVRCVDSSGYEISYVHYSGEIVEVKAEVGGDYNDVIWWAENERKEGRYEQKSYRS